MLQRCTWEMNLLDGKLHRKHEIGAFSPSPKPKWKNEFIHHLELRTFLKITSFFLKLTYKMINMIPWFTHK